MDPLFEIKLDRAQAGARDASRTLYDQLRAAILDGRLAPGARLPAHRRAADLFGVAKNTAAGVYDRLLSEGLVVTRHGAGTFVRAPPPAAATRKRPASRPAYDLNTFWLRPEVTQAMGFWRDAEAHTPLSAEPVIDFRPALVDSRLFPFDVYRRVIARQLRGLETRPASFKSPQGNQGNYGLRHAISRHVALTRSVACDAADVLVTSGAQQAFDLLARVLVTPGETVVAIEDPGYPPMGVAFAAAGARVAPTPVDEEGLIVEALPPDTKVICVCPSHQFPLGVTMSESRRRELVAFARAHNAVIVEDDYDGEYRFEGSFVEALRTGEAADVVFYVGTFSKCMLPSFRLGFIVAPDWAMPTLVAAKNCLDWHCSTAVQMGVAAFVADGELAAHVRRMREVYRRRRQVLLDALRGELSPWLEPVPSYYGMHVAAFSRTGRDLEPVAEALAGMNVKIHTLERYFRAPHAMTGFVFGYAAVDAAQLRHGLTQLRGELARGG
jgi:GntR family transcriptional regulator / MocR family aminotransferase